MDKLPVISRANTLQKHTNLKNSPFHSPMRSYAMFSAVCSGGLVFIVFGLLVFQSWPALSVARGSLMSTVWNPTAGQYGILPMIYGSVVVMMIAVALALPVGVLAAIYIAETRSDKIRRTLKSILEVLAGIPSIVYGLIGVTYLSLWIADGFELQTGRVILTAGILLAIMILPTILTLTEDAISNVPQAYRENAFALGLYRYEVIKSAVLPHAKTDIMGAALLALGRALGETMAVMLVIGSLDRIPTPIYNILSSGQTITSKLGREVGESAFGSTHFSVLVLTSLILVTLTLFITAMSQFLFSDRVRRA